MRWIQKSVAVYLGHQNKSDQFLRAAVSEMGKNWSQISDRYFPNRSPLSLSNRYTSFEQHSKDTTPLASQEQPHNSSVVEKTSKSTPPPNNVSNMDSNMDSNPEASNTLVPSSLSSQTDIIDRSHFNKALDGSELQFQWEDVPYDFAYDGMLLPNLEPSSSVDTALSQHCVPYLVNDLSPDAHILSTDIQITDSSIHTVQCQEGNHAPSSVSSQRSPSGTAKSVLVLENLDDETRDAVLRVIWSKKSRTTLRLE
ncbi:hypothetical protein EKO04_005140 [Ascochyta lentis]|uniref:Uncharacterized protein n=1 Tax=Ascochyta lentis TaxID=205686 RepID=A0A8H7J6H0_9PLEO|nr:hypothetical protein EKO04_005140 [Ascochyta lentis]